MATIVTRAGKGSALTHNEVDANFNNLNSAKVETSTISSFGATLVDDADAGAARTTLGLGSTDSPSFVNFTSSGTSTLATVDINAGAIDGTAIGSSSASTGAFTTLTGGNTTLTGYLRGPATFTIDPATHGDNTGSVVIAGNLMVNGTTTTVNSETLNVADKQITVAFGAGNAAAANGAGIKVDGADAILSYDATNDRFTMNKSLASNLVGNVTGNTSGTAATVTGAAQTNITSVGTLTALTVDTMTLDAATLTATGNFTLDSSGDITLDADGADIRFKDAGNTFGVLSSNGSDEFVIQAGTPDKDIIFKGTDDSSIITALTLDMSEGGIASFNAQVRAPSQSTSAPSFSFTNDTDTGISRPTTNALNLITGGTERMRIDSSGSLLFNGNGVVSVQSNSSNFYLGGGSYSPSELHLESGSFTAFKVNGSERIRITSAGNVGIGNTSPQGRLHINDSGTTIPTSGYGTGLMVSRTDGLIGTMFGFLNSPQSGYLQAANFTNTNTHPFLINPRGGNVGIGTASPSANTEIRGSSSNGQIRLGGSTAGTYASFYSDNDGVLVLGADAGNNASNSYFGVEVDGSERMRIDSSGNVGIGNNNPAYDIDILDTTTASNIGAGLSISHATQPQLRFAQTTGNYRMYIGIRTNDLVISNDSGAEKVRFEQNGNVGIGESSPQGRLHLKKTDTGNSPQNAAGNQLVIENGDSSGSADIQFLSASNGYNHIFFGDAADANVGVLLYAHTDNSMRFQVNATERMRIDSSGNVGIGTTSPSAMLHLSGTDPILKFTDTLGADDYGLFVNATGYFGFYNFTDSRVDMAIDGSGNVGIGTTSPTHKLHVEGTVKVTGLQTFNVDSGGGSYISINHAGNESWTWDARSGSGSNDYLDVGISGGTRAMSWHEDGKVGIGTTSPGSQLHLSTSTAQNDAHGQLKVVQTDTSGGASTNAGINLMNHYGTSQFMQWEDNGLRIGSRILTNSGNGNVILTTGADAEAMRLLANGNVGIGTSSPDNTLHVHTNSAGSVTANVDFDDLVVENNTNMGMSFLSPNNTFQQIGFGDVDDNDIGKIIYQHTNDSMQFVVNASERMRITSAGNVGIGENDPDSTLTVKGASHTNFQVKSNSESTKAFIQTVQDSDVRIGSSTNHPVSFYQNGGEVMRISANGSGKRFTMGTTSPLNGGGAMASFVFSGAQGVFISTVNQSGGQCMGFVHQQSSVVGSINITSSATQYATSSDYRLKENVDYTWDATTRLKQLKPARFNFIADDTNTLVDGFLAHEVSSVVPNAVVGTKDAMKEEVLYVEDDELPDGKNVGDVKEAVRPDYQHMDHSKLVPLLVKTIQELEARITALEA